MNMREVMVPVIEEIYSNADPIKHRDDWHYFISKRLVFYQPDIIILTMSTVTISATLRRNQIITLILRQLECRKRRFQQFVIVRIGSE